MSSASQIIVALDYARAADALAFADRVKPSLCRLKVGKELFTRAGPPLVESLCRKGFDVFLDLKFHDIPNTVAGACKAAAELGVWMVNVHASGGSRMMAAAREAVDSCAHRPLLIGVTVLTSMDAGDLHGVGIDVSPDEQVSRLAGLAHESGLDGVVCSAREITRLRSENGPDFQLVTPGIRPAGDAAGDQRRVMTPSEAIAAGSSYLVIGRPITQAEDPVGKLLTIESEITRS